MSQASSLSKVGTALQAADDILPRLNSQQVPLQCFLREPTGKPARLGFSRKLRRGKSPCQLRASYTAARFARARTSPADPALLHGVVKRKSDSFDDALSIHSPSPTQFSTQPSFGGLAENRSMRRFAKQESVPISSLQRGLRIAPIISFNVIPQRRAKPRVVGDKFEIDGDRT